MGGQMDLFFFMFRDDGVGHAYVGAGVEMNLKLEGPNFKRSKLEGLPHSRLSRKLKLCTQPGQRSFNNLRGETSKRGNSKLVGCQSIVVHQAFKNNQCRRTAARPHHIAWLYALADRTDLGAKSRRGAGTEGTSLRSQKYYSAFQCSNSKTSA